MSKEPDGFGKSIVDGVGEGIFEIVFQIIAAVVFFAIVAAVVFAFTGKKPNDHQPTKFKFSSEQSLLKDAVAKTNGLGAYTLDVRLDENGEQTQKELLKDTASRCSVTFVKGKMVSRLCGKDRFVLKNGCFVNQRQVNPLRDRGTDILEDSGLSYLLVNPGRDGKITEYKVDYAKTMTISGKTEKTTLQSTKRTGEFKIVVDSNKVIQSAFIKALENGKTVRKDIVVGKGKPVPPAPKTVCA